MSAKDKATRRKGSWWMLLFTLVGLFGVISGLAYVKWTQFSTMFAGMAKMAPPPEAITTATVTRDVWRPRITAIGSTTAVQRVAISADVSGMVKTIAFESGTTVKAGEVLVELDSTMEQAQLRAALASAELAQANLDRARDLRGKNVLSAADLDTAEAQYKQAIAQADTARIAVAKRTVKAPFSGYLGLRTVNLGQFLDKGVPIVTLQSLDPIYVDFAIPQRYLSQLHMGTPVQVTVDAFAGQTFNGKVTAISPEVDAGTRTVRLQATLQNSRIELQPGMFVQVSAILPESETVLQIPATAVLYAPYGDSVFVVEDQHDEKTAKASQVLNQKFIRLGPTRGDFVIVLSGVEEGQAIASAGVFKLRHGAAVVIDNTLAPKAHVAPKPDNS